MVVMQKSYQNIQNDHAQTEEFLKYIRESIQQDYMVTTQQTRYLQIRLRLMIKMKLERKTIVQVLEMLQPSLEKSKVSVMCQCD